MGAVRAVGRVAIVLIDGVRAAVGHVRVVAAVMAGRGAVVVQNVGHGVRVRSVDVRRIRVRVLVGLSDRECCRRRPEGNGKVDSSRQSSVVTRQHKLL